MANPSPPKRGGAARTRPRDLLGWQRGIQCLQLRLAGASWSAIARQVGYANEGSAWKAGMRVLEATAREPAEKVRRLVLMRLDAALLPIWPRIVRGEVEATELMLKIEDMRCRVTGVFKPEPGGLTFNQLNVGPGAGATAVIALPAFPTEEQRHEYLRQCAFVLTAGAGATPPPRVVEVEAVEEGEQAPPGGDGTGAGGNGAGGEGEPG